MQSVQFVKGIILVQHEEVKWENNSTLTKKINWGMLFSHHPPCQYDRTYCFLHLKLCTRCTGIILGAICSIILTYLTKIEVKLIIIGVVVFPLPAILNFILNELGKLKNNNFKRIFTGILLGFVIGLAINYLLCGNYLIGFLIILWVFFLEIIVAIILHRANVLESFMEQYEDGIYKN